MAELGARQQQFQDRLKRVHAGGANTASQIYAGTPEPVRKRKRYETRASMASIERPNRSFGRLLVHLLLGLLIGAAAVVLARYLRFELGVGALTGPDADIFMAIDIILAGTLAIILRAIFRLKSRLHGLSKLAGVLGMAVLMQNAVHALPGPFEKAFSAQWVQQVVANTRASSFLIAGQSYNFSMQIYVVASNLNQPR